MANRFLDTNYYKSPFVRSLKGSLKSLYSFIICDCDGAGIWHLDLQAASLYIGFEISAEEFENHFVITGKAVNIGQNRYFFPDFIEHQYPKGLQAENRAHKNFISTLKKFGLIDENLNVKKGASKGLQSPTGLGLGQSNGNGLGHGSEVFFDAEEQVIKNQIEFERICMTTRKSKEEAEVSLHKYHLYLAEKEQYPKTRKAIFAGFEKWLINEKQFTNGSKSYQQVLGNGAAPGTSEARINKAKDW